MHGLFTESKIVTQDEHRPCLKSSRSKWRVNLSLEPSPPFPSLTTSSPFPSPPSFPSLPFPSLLFSSLHNLLPWKILSTWPAIYMMMIHKCIFSGLFQGSKVISRSLVNISSWKDYGDFKLNTIWLIPILRSKLCWESDWPSMDQVTILVPSVLCTRQRWAWNDGDTERKVPNYTRKVR